MQQSDEDGAVVSASHSLTESPSALGLLDVCLLPLCIVLVFLHKTLFIVNWKAAMILLSGQLADAIATPLVGIWSDRSRGLHLGRFYLGRRHLFHFIGTILVLVNFFCLFGRCIMCDMLGTSDATDASSDADIAYFALAAAFFNFGWAAIQVSHLAMVPELSSDESARVQLNSVRYAGTVASNLAVFGILAILMHWPPDLSAEDQFHYLAYIVLGIGTLFSVVFYIGTAETSPDAMVQLPQSQARHEKLRKLSNPATRQQQQRINAATANDYRSLSDEPTDTPALSTSSSFVSSNPSSATPADSAGHQQLEASEMEAVMLLHLTQLPVRFFTYRCWLRQREFYSAMFIYMCSRIVVNVSQVFVSYYLLDALHMSDLYITLIPAVLYVSSLLAASSMRFLSAHFGRKALYVIGFAVASAGLAAMFFLPAAPNPWHWLVFPSAVLVGFGNSVVMVSCTQLTSDLLGSRTNYAAFIFGCFSFSDKLACGAIIALLQALYDDSAWFARCVVPSAPVAGAAATLVLLTQVNLHPWQHKHKLSSNALRGTRSRDSSPKGATSRSSSRRAARRLQRDTHERSTAKASRARATCSRTR